MTRCPMTGDAELSKINPVQIGPDGSLVAWAFLPNGVAFVAWTC